MEIWIRLGRSHQISFGVVKVELLRIMEGLEGKGFEIE